VTGKDISSGSDDGGTPRTQGATVRGVLAYTIFVVLFAVVYERGDDAVDAVYERAEVTIDNWQGLVASLGTPGTGLEYMDSDVISVVNMLKAHNVGAYRITSGFLVARGGYLYQRTAEVSWPIREAAEAKFILRASHEKTPCSEVATAGEVALDRCD
jgi:hypothetical protein